MSNRRMPKSLVTWLVPRLRRISLIWVGKSIARDQAKVQVPDGNFKNGKPKFKTMYKCVECERQGIKKYHERELTQMDHRDPVIEVTGFTNWDDYINRLFCDPSGFDCLCLDHHEEKTGKENIKRRFNRQKAAKKATKPNRVVYKASKKVNKRLTSRKK